MSGGPIRQRPGKEHLYVTPYTLFAHEWCKARRLGPSGSRNEIAKAYHALTDVEWAYYIKVAAENAEEKDRQEREKRHADKLAWMAQATPEERETEIERIAHERAHREIQEAGRFSLREVQERQDKREAESRMLRAAQKQREEREAQLRVWSDHQTEHERVRQEARLTAKRDELNAWRRVMGFQPWSPLHVLTSHELLSGPPPHRHVHIPPIPKDGEPIAAEGAPESELCTLCATRYRCTTAQPCGCRYSCITCLHRTTPMTQCDYCRQEVNSYVMSRNM
jgi:hypothetical protein